MLKRSHSFVCYFTVVNVHGLKIFTNNDLYAINYVQLVAQAELVAANEERIQSSRSSGGASTSRQPITSSLLSSALASAGMFSGSSTRSEGLSKVILKLYS